MDHIRMYDAPGLLMLMLMLTLLPGKHSRI